MINFLIYIAYGCSAVYIIKYLYYVYIVKHPPNEVWEEMDKSGLFFTMREKL